MTDLLDRLASALSDRYTIERELGHGGMAVVYLARDVKHGRQVAIKVLRPELAASLGAERFLREIQIAAQLQHPNILTLIDSGEADGLLYYTMPIVEGESLRDRLTRERQLPIDDALQITREVADALGYAHALGIVHRDIKPENVLFQAGHAVVSDFGIARAVSEAGAATLTETGLAVGTPAYMSPEQATGAKDIDARSDLYSLGCVLYEMLGGETPHLGNTAQAIIAKKLTEPARRVSVVRERVPAAVETALDRVLARTPADRFATATQFVEALRTPSGEVAAVTERRPRARRWALGHWPEALIWIPVVLGLVGGGIWIWQGLTRNDGGAADVDEQLYVVLPFRVLGVDTVLASFARSMPGYFQLKLTGIAGPVSADPGLAEDWWRERGGSVTEAFPESVAREIAERLRAGRVVMGAVEDLGSRVRLTARVLTVPRGADRRPESVEGSRDSLPQLVDALAVKLLAREVGEAAYNIPSLTAHDPEAVELYLAGMRLGGESQEHWAEAAALFRDALEKDPTFALAAMYGFAFGEVDSVLLERTWALRDLLGRKDRAYAEAIVRPKLEPRLSLAERVRLWEEAVRVAPENPETHWELAEELNPGVPDWERRQWAQVDQAVHYTPGCVAQSWMDKVRHWAVNTKNVARLRWAREAADSCYPGADAAPTDREYRELLVLGDTAAAAALLPVLRAEDGWYKMQCRDEGFLGSFALNLRLGVAEAERVCGALPVVPESFRNSEWWVSTNHWQAAAFWRGRGRYALWRAHRDTALTHFLQPELRIESRMFPPLHLRSTVVFDAAYLGEPEDPHLTEVLEWMSRVVTGEVHLTTLDTISRSGNLVTPSWQIQALSRAWWGHWQLHQGVAAPARAAIAYLRDSVPDPWATALDAALLEAMLVRAEGGDLRDPVLRLDSLALLHLTDAWGGTPFATTPLVADFLLTRLLAEIGEPERALDASRRRVIAITGRELFRTLTFVAERLREEGRLAVLTGDTAGALEAYNEYLTLRPDAPDYAPWREDWEQVRRELAALTAEPGGIRSP